MSIVDDLNKINNIKNEIKYAIRDKGVEMKDDTPFAEYPNRIRDIETGGGDPFYEDFYNIKTNNGTDMTSLFSGYKGTELDVSNLDTSNVTNMNWMFFGCNNLTSLDVKNFNTFNVRNMGGMFQDCNSLTSLDVNNFNTFNVEEMDSMFCGCNNLIELNVSNFNTGKVRRMNGMFQDCSNLTELNLSNFNTFMVEDMSGMFFDCRNLEILYLSNWVIDNADVGNMFMFCDNLHSLYLVGCSNETISKIINDSNLPTGTWGEEMRVIFCREKDRGDLEAPYGWEFSYKDDDDDGGDGGGDGGGDNGGDDDGDNGGNNNPGSGSGIIRFKAAGEMPQKDPVIRVNGREYTSNQLFYVDDIYGLDVGESITQLRFYSSSNISEIIELDVSNMTNMNEMFYGCTSLREIDANNWVTSAVREGGIFMQCTGLEIVDISNWDTSGMKHCPAFMGCTSLHTIRMDNCSNATIRMITGTGDFPSGTIDGVTRTIYCKEANVAGLTAPKGWVFSYVN